MIFTLSATASCLIDLTGKSSTVYSQVGPFDKEQALTEMLPQTGVR